MSFLRALRAYVGLGPEDEIEDHYLYELNARRRELRLDELEEGVVDTADFDMPVSRRDEIDLRFDELPDFDGESIDGNGYHPEADGSDRSHYGAVFDGGTGRDTDKTGHRAAVESDLASLGLADIRLEGGDDGPMPGTEDDGSAAVSATAAETATMAGSGGAVVHSLDSMRAKPRTLVPESFGDAKLVADEFKRGIPILLNLQSIDRDLARRLIDFASGICYALDGGMEKIASQVFLLIPDGSVVSDDDRRRIKERGYAR